jgi:hypothetical protein
VLSKEKKRPVAIVPENRRSPHRINSLF